MRMFLDVLQARETSRMKSSRRNLLVFYSLLGLAAGVGAFTFFYAKGYSYLTNDPAACANCHVMDDYYSAWQKGSHRAVAVCNDCHTPHDVVGKYVTKASNGFWHSFAFTTGDYPYPIQIKPQNRAVTEETCRYCHQEIVAAIDPEWHVTVSDTASRRTISDEPMSCIRCHDAVGHWVR